MWRSRRRYRMNIKTENDKENPTEVDHRSVWLSVAEGEKGGTEPARGKAVSIVVPTDRGQRQIDREGDIQRGRETNATTARQRRKTQRQL